MSDLEHSKQNRELTSEQDTAGSTGDTTQEPSDIGSLGVRRDGDLTDVDPLAVGLDDAASSLGEVVTEVMHDDRTEGVPERPSDTPST